MLSLNSSLILFIVMFFHPTPMNMTYSSLLTFLRADNTNQMVYQQGFDCNQFAEMLVRRARRAGFAADSIGIESYNENMQVVGHRFVSIYTADRGVVWVEPQDDGIYGSQDGRLCDDKGWCWPYTIGRIDVIHVP